MVRRIVREELLNEDEDVEGAEADVLDTYNDLKAYVRINGSESDGPKHSGRGWYEMMGEDWRVTKNPLLRPAVR